MKLQKFTYLGLGRVNLDQKQVGKVAVMPGH